jgi:hypothetical protein
MAFTNNTGAGASAPADNYREEKHFTVVYQYIKNNPASLGEAKASPPRFYGIYE